MEVPLGWLMEEAAVRRRACEMLEGAGLWRLQEVEEEHVEEEPQEQKAMALPQVVEEASSGWRAMSSQAELMEILWRVEGEAGVPRGVVELLAVLELGLTVHGVQLRSQTCRVSLGWHQCRRRHDCAIWASRQQKSHRVEVPGHWLLHLVPQILLHCCFAVYWLLGSMELEVQARKEVSWLLAPAAHRQQAVQLTLLHLSRVAVRIDRL